MSVSDSDPRLASGAITAERYLSPSGRDSALPLLLVTLLPGR